MVKIAFFDAKDYDINSFNEENKKYGYEITYFKNKLSSETAPLAKDHDVVCIFVNDLVDKETLKILQEGNVRIVALRCAGYNNIDLDNLPGKIKVVRVPDYSPYAVAEHTVGLLLSLNRRIYKAYQRAKKYNFSLDGLLGYDIHGKTVGVIGTGRIGKAFINIMNGFGTNVIAYDIYPDEESTKTLNFKYVSLDELFKSSDIISLHCPLTKETNHIINKESMLKMKDGVVILNTSRGKLINTKDLIKMMEKGKISGLGLDVYEEEEKYFLNDMSNSYIRDEELSILLSMPNVVITSHQAFFTKEALDGIVSTTFSNIKDVMEKGGSVNEIKK